MAVNVTHDEMAKTRQWITASFESEDVAALPFSFTYGGRPSGELLGTWAREWASRPLDDQRIEHTLTYRDPATGLAVRCVIVEYNDFPTIEWTLYFRNDPKVTGLRGSANTPILADIQALDVQQSGPHGLLPPPAEDEYILHHATGSPCAISDYQPWESSWSHWAKQRILGPTKRITAFGGRPSNSDMPYFNLEGRGEGVIVVIGWPGQWAAEFTRQPDRGLHVVAGQELTHFTLHPGEEVCSPLIVLQFWRGDYLRSQNIWRRWMLAHNVPRPGGKLLQPMSASSSSMWFNEMVNANEENQKLFIDRLVEEGVKPDYWWMDAGWYVNDGRWVNTGTWEVDTARFPHGLAAISDHAHAQGIKTIVWFEPERVTPDTWLYEKHPEWLLSRPERPGAPAWVRAWRLLDLGNAEARAWLIEHVDRLLVEQGIDLYRQDFNIDPLEFWRTSDAADRQGITEIKYVTGYLAYWDELRRRHPDMVIDTCASGGRRNDLETLRRAVPLHRSDYAHQAVGNQCHTYGISFWVPYHGIGVPQIDAYTFRSTLVPAFGYGPDMRRPDLDYGLMRRLVAEWREYADNTLGDYYPLTSYSYEDDVWMAWQFDRPEAGKGMVQVFRRSHSPFETARFQLHALEPDAQYAVKDVDTGEVQRFTGRELMDQGLSVMLKQRPAAAIFTYER